MSEMKPIGWTQIRHQLNDCSKPDLIALMKDLCDASSDNLDFLQARFQVEDGSGGALENKDPITGDSENLFLEAQVLLSGLGKFHPKVDRKAAEILHDHLNNFQNDIESLDPINRHKPQLDTHETAFWHTACSLELREFPYRKTS